MTLAASEARRTMKLGYGGPFGAVIVKDGRVLSVASNTVLKDCDPTAHGEINAIRKACAALKTHDLTGCEIYATGEPCPMCLSAIIWANIKRVYYANSAEKAGEIGFRDTPIYDFIRGKKGGAETELIKLGVPEAENIYNEYKEAGSVIY